MHSGDILRYADCAYRKEFWKPTLQGIVLAVTKNPWSAASGFQKEGLLKRLFHPSQPHSESWF